MTGMVLGLVVYPHMICDVSSREELATDVTGDLLLVANHVSAQTILRGKAGLAGLRKVISENYLSLKHFKSCRKRRLKHDAPDI